MTLARLAAFTLQWRLRLARRGGLEPCALALLAIGLAAWLGAVPQLARHLAARERALQDARRQADAPAPRATTPALPLAEQRLRDFHAALGDVGHVEQALRAIFAAAEQRDIDLAQSDDRLAYDARGRFYTYTLQMPVTGSYGAVRRFSEQVLLAVPCASLDEIDFKREDIGTRDLSARLRFTLHLDGPPGLADTAGGVVAGAAADGATRKAGTP